MVYGELPLARNGAPYTRAGLTTTLSATNKAHLDPRKQTYRSLRYGWWMRAHCICCQSPPRWRCIHRRQPLYTIRRRNAVHGVNAGSDNNHQQRHHTSRPRGHRALFGRRHHFGPGHSDARPPYLICEKGHSYCGRACASRDAHGNTFGFCYRRKQKRPRDDDALYARTWARTTHFLRHARVSTRRQNDNLGETTWSNEGRCKLPAATTVSGDGSLFQIHRCSPRTEES